MILHGLKKQSVQLNINGLHNTARLNVQLQINSGKHTWKTEAPLLHYAEGALLLKWLKKLGQKLSLQQFPVFCQRRTDG